MSYPIAIKYRHIESGETFQESNFSSIYLVDILNLLFTDDYKRGTLNCETFLFSLIDETEAWSSDKDLEIFLTEFKDFIVKASKFNKQVVLNKETNDKIDWFVTDIMPILKSKSVFNFVTPNPQYRALRLFDNLTFCIYDGTTNLSFTFDRLNLDDIFEAVPIAGTTDYQKGNKIRIIKTSISGLKKFERDLAELDNLKNFIKTNRLEFSFYDPNA